MTALTIQLPGSSQTQNIESLAIRHYEQVYAFFNAFYDDAALCLELTDRTFRDAESCGLTTECVFSKAIARLSYRPGFELPVRGASFESNVAWLLKEVGGLRYSEIGAVIGATASVVMALVAGARSTMLELLAA